MSEVPLQHRAIAMRGRDPGERHRASTPLELMFDLTFVLAFGAASSELAQGLAAGHVGHAIGGYAFATFAIAWAWISFSWFASAYDTDDWLFRLMTMVQMVGVLLLALGLPTMFASLEHGPFDNRVLVLGYVVMRVPMVFQWARAARQDPARRAVSIVYITSIIGSQIVWCLLVLVRDHLPVMAVLALLPLAIELSAPVIAERRYGGPPWHPHHIAERYSLVIIIALGEGLVGTLATLAAVVGPSGPGWSLEVAVIGLAGTALTFGMWWVYFMIPSGPILAAHRDRSFGWGYGHIVLFGATIAVGAGVHVAAFLIDRHSPLSLPSALLCTAIPVGLYIACVFVLYSTLTRSFDPFHVWMLLGSAILIAAPIVMACAGVALPWCLAVLALAPWVSVVGYELVGHRHNARILDELPE